MSKAKIVFVCEHGAAKSVLAREHFLRLARSRGLDVEALARGTDPDAEISPIVQRGLADDGYDANLARPGALSADDIRSATLVVSFDADVQSMVLDAVRTEQWDGLPSVNTDYASAKVAILARVENLVDQIEMEIRRGS
jgi:arsenate reductase